MKFPTLAEEKKLWRKGYKVVACIDEVGRGSLAGPVVACAVSIDSQLTPVKFSLRDSKQLTKKQRQKFYRILATHPAIQWGIGKVYPRVIDRINIYQATKLAMQRAVKNLEKKLSPKKVQFLLMDGNMRLPMPLAQKSIVKGDEKVFSCAIASIIAKVRRDRLMVSCHKLYPEYGFDKHKGYGTKHHIAMLKKYGPCEIHRESFSPIAEVVNTK